METNENNIPSAGITLGLLGFMLGQLNLDYLYNTESKDEKTEDSENEKSTTPL